MIPHRGAAFQPWPVKSDYHREPMREIHVVGAAILERGRCLVARRGPGMSLAGQWEFPGGKVEEGEDARAALAREIREELSLEISVGDLLGIGHVDDGAVRIRLEVYSATVERGELRLAEHSEARWIAPDEIASLDWAAADRPLLADVHRVLLRTGDL
jgi:8-oxo-dGTP diphosphatase